jgi:hypothetical protein
MSAAEPSKRVFMPTGDSSDFVKKPEKNTGTGGSKTKTLRLDLDLFEPDERTFPEFNYKKLVHIEKVIWTSIFLLLLYPLRGIRRSVKRKESIFSHLHCVRRCLLLFCWVASFALRSFSPS